MKNDFGIIKKSHGYAISYINDVVAHFFASILASKIMRKCQEDKMSAPIVSLAAQCSNGV